MSTFEYFPVNLNMQRVVEPLVLATPEDYARTNQNIRIEAARKLSEQLRTHCVVDGVAMTTDQLEADIKSELGTN